MRILLAYSGGLDTSYLIATLARQGHQVTACTVDCGGLTDADRRHLIEHALRLGAHNARCLDARDPLYRQVLRWFIAAHVRRGATYPLSVGAERSLQATVLAKVAQKEAFDALAHGCTAAGNDQIRFEGALTVVAPDLPILAPIRDQPVSREQQIQWLKSHSLPLPASGGQYSINAGLWGLTIGGGPLHDPAKPLPEEMWQWTAGASKSQQLSLQFEQGHPVAINGNLLNPVDCIEQLNQMAGACGVGRGYHLGDTVLGIKGRIAYEAPAAEVLLAAHRELEKLVLTEEQRFWKDHLGEIYGQRIHQGRYHDPLLRDFECLFESTQTRVSGSAFLSLEHGKAVVTGVTSPYSMLNASDATYGEQPASLSDPAGPAAFARILVEPARLYALAANQG
ncbi:MAG: argininosuccinate synthase [Planctomycetota bacterium]|nr:MAG: argininosuccinate synthase [Planctomycetota bacterium]